MSKYSNSSRLWEDPDFKYRPKYHELPHLQLPVETILLYLLQKYSPNIPAVRTG